MQAYAMQLYPGKQADTSKRHCLTHVPEALHTSNMQVLSQLLSTNRLQLSGGFGPPSPLPCPSPAEESHTTRQGTGTHYLATKEVVPPLATTKLNVINGSEGLY